MKLQRDHQNKNKWRAQNEVDILQESEKEWLRHWPICCHPEARSQTNTQTHRKFQYWTKEFPSVLCPSVLCDAQTFLTSLGTCVHPNSPNILDLVINHLFYHFFLQKWWCEKCTKHFWLLWKKQKLKLHFLGECSLSSRLLASQFFVNMVFFLPLNLICYLIIPLGNLTGSLYSLWVWNSRIIYKLV